MTQDGRPLVTENDVIIALWPVRVMVGTRAKTARIQEPVNCAATTD